MIMLPVIFFKVHFLFFETINAWLGPFLPLLVFLMIYLCGSLRGDTCPPCLVRFYVFGGFCVGRFWIGYTLGKDCLLFFCLAASGESYNLLYISQFE